MDFRDLLVIFILIVFFLILVTRGVVVDSHKTLCDEHRIILLKDSFYTCELIVERSDAKIPKPKIP